jgi:hypothetical protein
MEKRRKQRALSEKSVMAVLSDLSIAREIPYTTEIIVVWWIREWWGRGA